MKKRCKNCDKWTKCKGAGDVGGLCDEAVSERLGGVVSPTFGCVYWKKIVAEAEAAPVWKVEYAAGNYISVVKNGVSLGDWSRSDLPYMDGEFRKSLCEFLEWCLMLASKEKGSS